MYGSKTTETRKELKWMMNNRGHHVRGSPRLSTLPNNACTIIAPAYEACVFATVSARLADTALPNFDLSSTTLGGLA